MSYQGDFICAPLRWKIRSLCTPMYTCQLWWNFSVQSMHKLNVAYNNAFRFMHHLPTYCSASLMFAVNRVPTCRAVIRNRIYGFMKRLVSSSNALVLSAVTSDARYRSRIVRHWLKLLYTSKIPVQWTGQCYCVNQPPCHQAVRWRARYIAMNRSVGLKSI